MNKFLRLNSLFLSFVILFMTIFVSTTVNAEIIKIGIITEPGENKVGIIVRSDSSTKSDRVANVPDKTVVTVLDSKEEIEKTINPDTQKIYIWYKITYVTSGNTVTGYVRENFVEVSEYNTDPTFEEQLKEFPTAYHDALKSLHAMYPNWIFRADKVPNSLESAVKLQTGTLFRKLVHNKYISWRSMEKGYYDWSDKVWFTNSGGWYGASREVITYFMDPRNFLNANDIYMYMQQKYDANTQTVDGVKQIIKGTFLDAKISDKNDDYNGKTYAEVIIAAAKESKVNPYVLASTLIQEQGTKGSTLSSGVTYKKKTVYNFFNWGASGSTNEDVINNGAKYAYDAGWFIRSKAIIEGAKKYSSGYITDGQDTYFYKNFNVLDPENTWHQYAQNVEDSYSSAKKLQKMYADKKDINLTFRIPVYKSLPKKVSPLPAKNDKYNNYYFDTIKVSGLTPSFSRFTYEYSLSVSDDTSVYVKVPTGASITSADSFSLKKGDNTVKLVVKSETGYKNTYVINVDASKACTLSITTKKPTVETPNVKVGDANGDGKISLSDLAKIRLHLLKEITLKGDNLTGADANKDGKISLSDLAKVRLHLLGEIILK